MEEMVKMEPEVPEDSLVLKVNKVLQEKPVLKEQEDSLELKEKKVMLVQLVPQVLEEPEDILELKVNKDFKVKLVLKDQEDSLELLVKMVLLVLLVPLVQEDLLVKMEETEKMEPEDQEVTLVLKDLLVQPEDLLICPISVSLICLSILSIVTMM